MEKIEQNTLVDDNKDMFAGKCTGRIHSLRQAIRDYLHSARGVHCRPECILVGARSEYLLMLFTADGRNTGIALKILLISRRSVYLKVWDIQFFRCPHRWGMNVRELEKHRQVLLMVMPSHQYPTGIVIPIKRRQESF